MEIREAGMTDYGRQLQFGAFITPDAQRPDQVVDLVRVAEAAGFDLATFQDHPYQAGFLDTWTLISYAAAATERIRLAGNVLNLPLRPPAVLARSIASLDRLTGGRIELGIGAGGFWDAIKAMGGEQRRPAEAVQALEEAMVLMRELWDTEQRGGVRFHGRHYQVEGAKRGPAPAHRVEIWLGAYKPRMLELTGRLGDGWLPSEPYLRPGDLTRGNKIIDEAAAAAGRDPKEIRRLLNVTGAEPERLAELALTEGVDTFVLMGDDPTALARFGAEVVPAVRDLVERERRGVPDATTPGEPSSPQESPAPADELPEALRVRPTPDDGRRLLPDQPWDESTRPHRVVPPGGSYPARGQAVAQHLID